MRVRRIEVLLFVLAWTSYAYFHQGGGWNQNGRFALTRAIVETRRPWIDDYLVYAARGAKGSPALRRIPVQNGCFTDAGRQFALGWDDGQGSLAPMAPDAPEGAHVVSVGWVAATGDLAFVRGHTHPNKAPGTAFAAVPGYAVILGIERLFGIDSDAAWVINVNAWLSGVCSVGLVAALGVVLFWRLALRLSGGRTDASLFATIAFAFGTLYFPYATMLYEHDLVAVALLAAFLLVFEARTLPRLFGAGLCAGAAIVSSYLSVLAMAILGVYVIGRVRMRAGALAYVAGTIPPLLLLAAYNVACFGSIVATNYAWENPIFKQAGGGVLDAFTAPRAGVLLALLVSPHRGLLAGTPVLILGVIGLIAMLRSPELRAEGYVFLAMIAHVLAFNVAFKAWQGGWACGPRYLIPALPFLALPIALVSPRAAWVRRALLVLSMVAMALATTVDPQTPDADRGEPPVRPPWSVSPIWDIDLPQMLTGRPGAYAGATWPESLVARYAEPVSANPEGIFEGTPGRFFPLDSPEARWNSFNAGEFVLPGRRLSVIPWILVASVFCALIVKERRSTP